MRMMSEFINYNVKRRLFGKQSTYEEFLKRIMTKSDYLRGKKKINDAC